MDQVEEPEGNQEQSALGADVVAQAMLHVELFDGHFAGVILINLGIETQFTDFYKSLSIDSGSAIALWGMDKRLMIRHPIVDSEIENSVILERARITNVPRLVDSLIGRDTEVHRSGRRPRATRLMIGDHCTIDLD